jgi:autotransporter translocation and assembly factor TamB
LKQLLKWLLLLFATALVVLAVLPFTEAGTRQLLRVVDRYTPLEIVHGEGQLAGELHLERLGLAAGSVVLGLDDIRARMEPACLWRSALCFSRLEVRSFELEVQGADPGEEQAGTASGGNMVRIPVQVESEVLRVGSATIRWPGGRWEQGAMEASVQLGGEVITVMSARIDRPALYLEESNEPTPEGPIALPEIRLPLDLSVDGLELVSPALHLPAGAQAFDYLRLQGKWREHSLVLASLALESPDLGSLQTDGQISFEGDWPLSLSGELRPSVEERWTTLAGSSVRLVLSGGFQGLRIEAASEGDLSLALEGEANLLERTVPFDLTLTAEWQEALRLTDIADVTGPLAELELTAPARIAAQGNLLEQAVELTARASGLGYSDVALRLDAAHREQLVSIGQLSLRDAAGDNDLLLAGTIALDEGVTWDLSVESGGLDLPRVSEYAVGRLQGDLALSGQVAEEWWHLSVADADLSGEVNSMPAVVRGYAGLDRDLTFTASDLAAEINGARLQLQASGRPGDGGEFELALEDLGLWLPGGRGQFDARGTTARIGGRMQLSGQLRDLETGPLAVKAGEVSANYEPGQDFDISAQLSEVTVQGAEISRLVVRGSGDSARQGIELVADGDYRGQLALAGGPVAGGWKGALRATTVDTPFGSWQLDADVPLDWLAEPGRLTVEGHCWSNRRTRVCPGELRLAERSSASLEVRGDLDFVAALLPEEVDVDGDIDLSASAAWSEGALLELNGRAESRDVRITRHFGGDEKATIAWKRAQTTIEQRPDGLYVAADVAENGTPLVKLALVLPIDPERGALAGIAELNRLQLSYLAPLFPRLASLEGYLDGRVALGGTVAQPTGRGTVTLSGGRIAAVGNPTELEDLSLDLKLQGQRAAIAGRGVLGGGDVNLDGELHFSPKPRLELSVVGEQHRLLYPPSTDLLVSEQLRLVLVDGLLDVRGTVIVHEGTLQQESLPEGSVAVSSDVVVVDYAGNVIREERLFDTRLDIRIRMKDRIQVIGGGLNATVGGDLQVRQEPAQPLQLFGNLNIVGGRLVAYRQHLRIRRGTISFAGPPDNPQFNVRAEREIRGDNVTVGVELAGSLQNPRMTVYSDPVMEQSEAMSFLIRGRGLDSGAAADGTALALAMGADVVNQSGVLSNFDRLPGISQVQLGAEGEADDTAATVSGYIGDRIYIAYGVGIYEPINVLTARLYLSARLWIEVVSRLENSVDLYYSFDIR